MMLHQLVKKLIIFIVHQIIITDTGADKHLFHPRQRTNRTQDFQVAGVIDLQIGAALWKQAFPVFTGAKFTLLVTGLSGKIGSRAADIMDISLKIRHFCNPLRLIHDGILASGGYHTSLMMRDGTEGAGAETATVADNGKLHFFNGRYVGITGMIGSLIRQRIRKVHFLLCQRQRRLILHDIPAT